MEEKVGLEFCLGRSESRPEVLRQAAAAVELPRAEPFCRSFAMYLASS